MTREDTHYDDRSIAYEPDLEAERSRDRELMLETYQRLGEKSAWEMLKREEFRAVAYENVRGM